MKLPAFRLLSKEQDRILNLPLDGSYLVGGPPGSGKTVVALYRAQMLHQRQQRSVLLAFNRTLSSYMGSAVRELKVGTEPITYHRWLERTYRDYYSTSPPMLNAFDHDWNRILQRVNAQPPSPQMLPYLIVDEGQDLAPDFYLLARYLSKNVTILADGNQVISEKNSTFDDIRSRAGIKTPTEMLTRNYRNTVQIAALAAKFHSGIETGVPESPSRSGPPIALRRHRITGQTIQTIAMYFKQRSSSEIGVFLPTTALVKKYKNRLQSQVGVDRVQHHYRENGKLESNLDFEKPAIRVMNYWNVKGLEFDSVFLPELQAFTRDVAEGGTKMLFYVLLSRAREMLYMSYLESKSPMVATLRQYLLEIGEGLDEEDDFEKALKS